MASNTAAWSLQEMQFCLKTRNIEYLIQTVCPDTNTRVTIHKKCFTMCWIS